MTAPVPEATLPTVTTPPETYGLAREPEPPIDEVEEVSEPGPQGGNAAGPVKVQIVAPLPVPVSGLPGPGGSSGEGSGVPGGPAGAEEVVKKDQANVLAKALQRVSDSFAGLMKGFATIGSAGAQAFDALTRHALKFVAAASPVAIDTFTGSVKILSASIGQALLEPIALVSIKIQQLAEAFRNLDPHVKQQIGQWALWGTAISGGAMLLGRLTGVVTGLLPLLRCPARRQWRSR